MKNIFISSPIKQLSILLFIVVLLMACNKKEKQDIPVSKAIKGTFYKDVVETGDIQAINSIVIVSPSISWRYGALKITQIVKDGKEVKAGDTVIVFDPTEVQKAIVEAQSRLQISYAELDKLRAEQKSDMEDKKSNYEITKISQEILKIEFDGASYEAAIDQKKIELNLENANISLIKAKEQIDNLEKIQKEDIKQKMLSINQDKERLNEANETLNKLFLVSPSPGLAIINTNWSTRNKFQIGDQCWSGYPLIQLPDLGKLKATVQINEVDIAKIAKGLKVEIKPDAFSDSTFTGEVISVANLAINKDGTSKIKVFPVDILIHEKGKKLLPGLSVSCRILVKKIPNVIFIPIEAIHSDGLEEYVYVKTGNKFKKMVVKTGVSNTDHVIITKGLNAGDAVAMTDPFALKQAKGSKENDTKDTKKEGK